MNNDWKNSHNKNQNKVTNLLKKDGFYVTLFICLCIVAGVAAYVNLKPKHTSVSVSKTQTKVSKQTKTTKDGIKTAERNEKNNISKQRMENAEQVNKSSNLIKKDSNSSVSTSATAVKKLFVNPVQNGSVVMKFDTWYSKNGKYTNLPGEYVKPNQNINVTAAMDGVVKSVAAGKVTIANESNGFITVYDNLDEHSIAVKPNDNVKQGQLLGKIGDSNYSNKLVTDTSCAYFEIDQKQKDGSYMAVDPEKMLNVK